MITAKKIEQVQKQLRSGVPQGEIMEQLKQAGYTEEDISKVFIPHKPDMRNWYLLSAILFFVAGLFFISLLLFAGSAIMFSIYYAEHSRITKKKEL